jgi:hypothetical protein
MFSPAPDPAPGSEPFLPLIYLHVGHFPDRIVYKAGDLSPWEDGMQSIDPFIDQFVKLFAMLVGATVVAGLLWRANYQRRRRRDREKWATGST